MVFVYASIVISISMYDTIMYRYHDTKPICAAQLLLYFPSLPCVATSMQLHDSIHVTTLASPWKRSVWQHIR